MFEHLLIQIWNHQLLLNLVSDFLVVAEFFYLSYSNFYLNLKVFCEGKNSWTCDLLRLACSQKIIYSKCLMRTDMQDVLENLCMCTIVN